ncbi:hypothetical protein [Brevundimonas sp. FT23028]|uniref:hypothetical protein n=1 Tax=Brevundimonas sp. FT23028 TaxID=3393748 RepID=UPI003B586C32
MQALINLIAGFIAMLAAAALSQFGLDIDASPKPEREIHRVRDCGPETPAAAITGSADQKRDC